MSYDINLLDPVTKTVILLDEPHQMGGGTYRVGGTRELTLNVTYNYGDIYRKVIDTQEGIRFLYGKTGAESIPILKAAISKLEDDVHEDYWKPTEGNAKRALCKLLTMAQMRPDGIWSGD